VPQYDEWQWHGARHGASSNTSACSKEVDQPAVTAVFIHVDSVHAHQVRLQSLPRHATTHVAVCWQVSVAAVSSNLQLICL
jgi:hypothetical protein